MTCKKFIKLVELIGRGKGLQVVVSGTDMSYLWVICVVNENVVCEYSCFSLLLVAGMDVYQTCGAQNNSLKL